MKEKQLSQFFTPAWAAEILFNEHFSHLGPDDLVWEPSCGSGACLSAIPKNIPAIGSDIDSELVNLAAENTGRKTYPGDFRSIIFDELNKVTAVFGNPPFQLKFFEEFMARCENILKIGNKAGFILPAYFFQTSATVMRFSKKWAISQEIIPRDLFQGAGLLSKPLVFASFIRDNSPCLVGFRLHAELCDINALGSEIKEIVTRRIKRNGSVWKEVVMTIVRDLGGKATLDQVYSKMEGKRPTANPFWKEQARKVLQQSPFIRVSESTYQLN